MSLRQAVVGLFKRLRYPSYSLPATSLPKINHLPNSVISGTGYSRQYDNRGGYRWSRCHDAFRWIFISGQAVLFLGMYTAPVLAEDVSVNLTSETDSSGDDLAGFRKIEDGSVQSNIHTSKWRVFTDSGRERFLQGKLDDAERLFRAAIEEAKEGFGERDPHVASSCNNLAELYRVKKAFDKAEPLYLEAVNVLEEAFGSDDIRLGATYHNLGQFYIVQRKWEEARVYYERALKIKRRVLGEGNPDYADTMYHLGTVLYLQGNVKDAEALIQGSIRILEDSGQGESNICIRRLRYLAQMYFKSNRSVDAENVQRKILQKMELSKGWNSLDTVLAAESLVSVLESVGSLREAKDLLERCLIARRTLLSEDHIQIAANLFRLARVEMRNSNQLKKASCSEAITELDKAKDHLGNAIRIARLALNKLMREEGKKKFIGTPRDTTRERHAALMILMSSLNSLGMLEITKMELLGSWEDPTPVLNAKNALHQCVSAFNEFGTGRSLPDHGEADAEYHLCSRRLAALSRVTDTTELSKGTILQELKD